ncbi:MAG TPA: nitrate- and nitrite sensing domain-containing protein, partial [Frankiaceae bacterium]|nr:nitrate- and nitrite sensing domain-containing protein [Frankiaceae bacterium]
MLRNWPIRSKLATILVMPLLALALFSAVQVSAGVSRVGETGHVRDLTRYAVVTNDLVHELQRERGLSGGYVASGRTSGLPDVQAQRRLTDVALATYRARSAGLDLGAGDQRVRAAIGAVNRRLAGLGAHRQLVDNRPVDVNQTLGYYTDAVADLLQVDAEIGVISRNPDLVRQAQAFVSLSRAKEAVALERGFMNSVFAAGRFRPSDYQRFLAVLGDQGAWLAQFRAAATDQERAFYDATLTGPDVERAAALRDRALAAGDAQRPTEVDPRVWWAAMSGKVDRLRTVEVRLAGDLSAAADRIAGRTERQAALDVLFALGVLGLSAALSLLVARSMVDPLRRMRTSALEVANERLPTLVERL